MQIGRRRLVAAGNSAQSGTGWGSGNAGIGGGSGWNFPNAGGGVLGPGANAPSWSGKTVYAEEGFATPLTTTERNGGFRRLGGFEDPAASGSVRVTYPTLDTPVGSKPCLRLNSFGQTEFIDGAGQTTTPWDHTTGFNEIYRAAIYTKGTWSGTLEFEVSDDGGATWASYFLNAGVISGSPHVSGTSTTINGHWITPSTGGRRLLRVRASAWTSGTAEVRVGQIGGFATANFFAGRFTGGPTRIYQRYLHRISANWTDGENQGTKGPFWLEDGSGVANQRMGHYMFQRANGFGLQGVQELVVDNGGIATPADGEWLDCEQIIYTGTPGNADGRVEMWVNGVKHIDRSSLLIIPSTKTAAISLINNNPTYGGGTRPVPQHQWHEFSNFYRESAP